MKNQGNASKYETPIQKKRYLQQRTVQKILSCSKEFVRKLVTQGDLEAIRIGKRAIRISEDSLIAYIEGAKMEPEDLFE